MKTVLFQGDSITDCGRSRESEDQMGMGYAWMVSGSLAFENPGEYVWYNRGISGNRIVDLYARIKEDILNLKPDYMSILIGVNDAWHEYIRQSGVDAEKFEKIYGMLIEEIKEALPDIKIMILEPFCLGTETIDPSLGKEVKKRAEKAKAIAEKYQLTFIPLQDKFDAAAELAPYTYWLRDGVHPTYAGHELIKREWIKAFEKLG